MEMAVITKIRLWNFRRFRNYTIEPNEKFNVFVGDNEVGKSTILEAIDIVASGNIRWVEAIGLDKLFNIDSVREFNAGRRDFNHLPVLRIELYLSGDFDHTMNGKNNLDGRTCDGIRLVCEPNPDFSSEISEALYTNETYFPYDYYSIRFSTFADLGYSGYKKKIRTVLIDSTSMSSEYATTDFVRRMYHHCTETDAAARALHKSQYRLMRSRYGAESLKSLNERVHPEGQYTFGLKSRTSLDFENDLMIYEGNIGIDSRGTGRQVFIKTNFALKRSGDNVDVILIEEPENHLSPVNLRKLVQDVANTQGGQLFITTHNSLISTRLELKNLLIMHADNGETPIKLRDLSDDTAKYFMKTPPAGIIEYALSKKAILVEGPSEYMLLDCFYKQVTGHSPEDDEVNIIDIRGLSFKRYLEIAVLTGSKIAVITDNDKDWQKHCVDKYCEFKNTANIQIFYHTDNNEWTLEVVLYVGNQVLCDKLFKADALEYMLKNKTEAAYCLLEQQQSIVVPEYIVRALNWIRQ